MSDAGGPRERQPSAREFYVCGVVSRCPTLWGPSKANAYALLAPHNAYALLGSYNAYALLGPHNVGQGKSGSPHELISECSEQFMQPNN